MCEEKKRVKDNAQVYPELSDRENGHLSRWANYEKKFGEDSKSLVFDMLKFGMFCFQKALLKTDTLFIFYRIQEAQNWNQKNY